MTPDPQPGHPYLKRYIRDLIALTANLPHPEATSFDAGFLLDVAYYIWRRIQPAGDVSEVCALLGEAWQKLEKRIGEDPQKVDSLPNYFRMVVKNLLNDRHREDTRDIRLMVSTEGLAELAEAGLPTALVERLAELHSPLPVSIRTFSEQFDALCDSLEIEPGKRAFYRNCARNAFRFHLREDRSESVERPNGHHLTTSQWVDADILLACIRGLKSREQELLKLRLGLAGTEENARSFAELQKHFDLKSVKEAQNQYHYCIQKIRNCLRQKGIQW